MSIKGSLMSTGLSITSAIELVVLLLIILLFNCWISFIIILAFFIYIGLKIFKLMKQPKKAERLTIFNENIPKTMKAALYSNSWRKIIDFGEYYVPEITKPDEILVRVHCASLNPVDYKIIYTRIPFIRWMFFPYYGIGKDFSGEVVQIGSGVTKFRIGDNVFGFSKMGTFQEYTITQEHLIALMPDRMEFIKAASLPLVGCTTYQALTFFNRIGNKDNQYTEFGLEDDLSGKNILVIGASGGCGTIGLQVAKFLNANEIYGVCSSENVDLIKDIHICTDVFPYNAPNFEEILNGALISEDGEKKIDLILDTVSSREDGDKSQFYMKYLKNDGKYVALNSNSIIRFITGFIRSFKPSINLEKNQTHVHFLNRDDNKGLEILSKMISQGRINFFIRKFVFDYNSIEEAIKELKSRRVKGKLVCNIIDDNILV